MHIYTITSQMFITGSKFIASILSNPATQDFIVKQIFSNAAGVGIGIILALAGLVLLAKALGIGDLIKGWLQVQKESTDNLRMLNSKFDTNKDTATVQRFEIETNIKKEVESSKDQILEELNKIEKNTEEVLREVKSVRTELTNHINDPRFNR